MLFRKGKIPRLKLCKTCRVPFVPDADVGTDDLTAEGREAWSCVQGLAAVKRHSQVCADGSLGGLTRIGVDAAGQIAATRARVAALTVPLLFSTRETVAMETPASLAIS